MVGTILGTVFFLALVVAMNTKGKTQFKWVCLMCGVAIVLGIFVGK